MCLLFSLITNLPKKKRYNSETNRLAQSNIVDMGCVSSKTVDEGGRADHGSTDGEYIAKQDVTIWSYIDDGTNLRPHTIPEKTRVRWQK